ncbi:uncharacterized protein LOC144303606 isoform X1 [Canis aureus]
MSEIAAIVLMFLPEDDAFWALAQLMVSPADDRHGFFVPGFQKLLRFQAHHERVLERALPDLRKHMDEEQMSTGIYTPKWFLQCFLGRVRPSRDPRSWTCPLSPGRAQLSPTLQTSQAQPRGPEAEARSPAHPGEAQRVPGRGSGGRAVSASAPPGEAGSAWGVDGPPAHRAASLGSSQGVVSSSAGRVCPPRGAGGAGRGRNPERPGALISLGGGHARGAVGPRRRQPGGRWQA